jgi:dTDP-4-amino-4,6-dideoxygalactose transaminase
MTPWHMPPFGLGQLLRSTAGLTTWPDLERIEQAYARELKISHAIWFPSGRAGIYWALQAALGSTGTVLCPAYTCRVVHEAVARSGAEYKFIDAAAHGFLLNVEALRPYLTGRYALVLSELYGHTYDLAAMAALSKNPPVIRIIDMAMTVPTQQLMARLKENDFGVISFGMGKCLYAGWGGMGFTNDEVLAHKIRRLRDQAVGPANLKLIGRRIVQIWGRTAIHNLGLYGAARWMQKKALAGKAPPRHQERKADGLDLTTNGWSAHCAAPSTYLDRQLILYNLQQSQWHAQLRCAQAARYRKNLQDVRGIVLPEESVFPLSFFTIRLRADVRKQVKEELWRKGISTGTLFAPERYLPPDQFPNANRLANEILNLPINPTLMDGDIDRICEGVATCVSLHVKDDIKP